LRGGGEADGVEKYCYKMIGVDIVQIKRIARAAENPAFLKRVYTAAELEYYKAGGERAETLAGMYALKEAAAKALGTGFNGFNLKDVEVLHDGQGAPHIQFHGKAREVFESKKTELNDEETKAAGNAGKAGGVKKESGINKAVEDTRIECSVSHEKKYAVAVVILNQKQVVSEIKIEN